MNTKVTYTNHILSFTNNDKEYRVDVSATANYWYQPCVMYFRDGTGQPENWDFEIEKIESTWYEKKEDGSEVKIEPNEDMLEELEDYIVNDVDEWDFPEEPECDEPEDY